MNTKRAQPMLFERFAEFLLKRRSNAIVLALLFSALPYFGWVSGIIVGFITMRKGIAEGFMIMLWASLPAIVMVFHTGEWISFVAAVIYGYLLVWILAVLLVRKANWSAVLYVATCLGLLGVVTMHFVIPSTAQWWLQYFTQGIKQVELAVTLPQTTEQNIDHLLKIFSRVATGLQVMMFILAAVVELFMAKGLEARYLRKPNSLIKEAYGIRVHWFVTLIFIGCLVAAKMGSALFMDMLPVLLLPFVLAGVSLIHACLIWGKTKPIWLVVFYALLMMIVLFMPALLLLIVAMAMIDSVFNFRQRFFKEEFRSLRKS